MQGLAFLIIIWIIGAVISKLSKPSEEDKERSSEGQDGFVANNDEIRNFLNSVRQSAKPVSSRQALEEMAPKPVQRTARPSVASATPKQKAKPQLQPTPPPPAKKVQKKPSLVAVASKPLCDTTPSPESEEHRKEKIGPRVRKLILTRKNMRHAVILSEVLKKPVSMRSK